MGTWWNIETEVEKKSASSAKHLDEGSGSMYQVLIESKGWNRGKC